MRKNGLRILIESCSDRKDIVALKKAFSREFLRKTCHHARSMVKYLNLSMSVDAFNYVFHNSKSSNYSSFLRIYNRIEQY